MQNIRGYSALESGVRTLPMTLIVMADRADRGPPLDPHRAASADGGRHADHVARAGLAHAALDRLVSYWTVIFPSFLFVGAGVSMTHADDDRASRWARSTRRARASPRASSTPRGRSAARSASRCSARSPRRSPRRQLERQRSGGAAGHRGRASSRSWSAGRSSTIARAAGPDAGLAASHAFIDGVTTAMTVGSLLALAGAIIAFIGLRGFRPVAAPQSDAGRRRGVDV